MLSQLRDLVDQLADILMGWRARPRPAAPGTMIGRFVPLADVCEYHEARINAPADVVMQAARALDLSSLPLVRTLFSVRSRLLRGAPARRLPRPAIGLVAEMEAMGWSCLAERPGLEYVAGAAARPWLADASFRPIPATDFAAWGEPGFVKIAWSLEAEPLSAETTLFRTQTRAVATDETTRRRFLRYWRLVGPGVVLIRHQMLQSLKQEAERLRRLPRPRERRVSHREPQGSFT